MKTRNITLIVVMALLLALVQAVPYGRTCFGAESDGSHPYLGVLLDTSPLPELLNKHLGLPPGQGVRIRNIQTNSPAEEAGLERDDIITRIGDKDVFRYESVVFAVQEAGIGEEISLDIIHLGQPKTFKIKLGATKGEPEWKYPPEPEAEQVWRPGRIFRMGPNDQEWKEIFGDKLPSGFNMNKLFKETYTTFHYDGNESYKIVIEGDPTDKDSTITINSGNTEYKTTIGQLSELPEKYRKNAESAIENARKRSTDRNLWNSIQPPIDLKDNMMWQMPSQNWPSGQMFQPDKRMNDNIQKQMTELMDRIKELEKSQSELLDRLTKEKQTDNTSEQNESIL
ncbi:MAG: PDZ domain-containing protein [Sedimentisphaerales bacterium]|nr:PDZ domain-containing protein [Sedimentisphaerales bacterium]